ncbi:glycoside hydrolase family 43 protein [Microbacterium sp. B19]|uniref:glycoside hydrolase family 43 protein n=1 Tax=Microbacterium sp. B19 TaxID=96765 RepID=UPI0003450349|nr:glycoside hydrolase family 43 protein [Microbacterium sp. B19]
MEFDRYLFAYFVNGSDADAEQVRFAVSHDATAKGWTPLRAGAPVLRSTVGERGVRDPFLTRDPRTGRVHLLATDLHAAVGDAEGGAWDRAVRHGSRSIVVWSSDDLVRWTPPHLATIAPAEAGNAWAPKAFWRPDLGGWSVFYASALYPEGDARARERHQRVLSVETTDFREFSAPRTFLDPGHDVIDVTFVEFGGRLHRFSADSLTDVPDEKWRFVSHEVGTAIDDPDFAVVRRDLGRPELERAEGPAPFPALDGSVLFLLLDEFEKRGCQLFRSDDPPSGRWEHVPDAGLPEGARHGSVLPITTVEAERLLETEDPS